MPTLCLFLLPPRPAHPGALYLASCRAGCASILRSRAGQDPHAQNPTWSFPLNNPVLMNRRASMCSIVILRLHCCLTFCVSVWYTLSWFMSIFFPHWSYATVAKINEGVVKLCMRTCLKGRQLSIKCVTQNTFRVCRFCLVANMLITVRTNAEVFALTLFVTIIKNSVRTKFRGGFHVKFIAV